MRIWERRSGGAFAPPRALPKAATFREALRLRAPLQQRKLALPCSGTVVALRRRAVGGFAVRNGIGFAVRASGRWHLHAACESRVRDLLFGVADRAHETGVIADHDGEPARAGQRGVDERAREQQVMTTV